MLYSDIAFITFSICCDDNRELDAYPRVMSTHGRCKDFLPRKKLSNYYVYSMYDSKNIHVHF